MDQGRHGALFVFMNGLTYLSPSFLHFISFSQFKEGEKRFGGSLLTFEDNWGIVPFIIHSTGRLRLVEKNVVFVNLKKSHQLSLSFSPMFLFN